MEQMSTVARWSRIREHTLSTQETLVTQLNRSTESVKSSLFPSYSKIDAVYLFCRCLKVFAKRVPIPVLYFAETF